MQEQTQTSPRLRTLLGTLSTMATVVILALFSAVALVASDEAQRVFVTFLVLAAVGFATRTRKYSPENDDG